MDVIVFPVTASALNTAQLIKACRELKLGNPAEIADKKKLQGLHHSFAVLDSLQTEPGLTKTILSIGYMIIAWPDDLANILLYTCGMNYIHVARTGRVDSAIVTGSIADWMRAVEVACHPNVEQPTRYAFNRVYRDLEQRVPHGLGRTRDNGDGTFLLESS
jgi:hypothetical protein